MVTRLAVSSLQALSSKLSLHQMQKGTCVLRLKSTNLSAHTTTLLRDTARPLIAGMDSTRHYLYAFPFQLKSCLVNSMLRSILRRIYIISRVAVLWAT